MTLKTVSTAVALVVTVGCSAYAFTSWVWASSAESAQRDMRLVALETQTREVSESLREHIDNAKTATVRQDNAIRDLGALQLEQSEDQRRILLRIAPRGTNPDKTPELQAAEARVRRH